MNPLRFSIIINTYNRLHTLPAALRSLAGLRYPDYEVIVVDGPSTDGTSAWLARQAGIQRAECPVANLSVSRNVGLSLASGDVICFLDDDAMPEPDWLNRLAPAYADPEVGAVGGFVRDNGGVDYQARYILSDRDSRSEMLAELPAEYQRQQPGDRRILGMMGVNSSFRRSALAAVGGFDEHYAYYLDETDLLMRLVDAGYQVRLEPEAEVHHQFAASHLRDDRRIFRALEPMLRSAAYYCLRTAEPGIGLNERLARVRATSERFRRDVHWLGSCGLIDTLTRDRLLAEIDTGARAGLHAAMARPWRTLWRPGPVLPEWRPYPTPLPAEQRLRLCLVTQDYPPDPCGGVGVFMHDLAAALAERGHEITVIARSRAGEGERPHRVEFVDGIWVHRVIEELGVGQTPPPELPPMPWGLQRYALAVAAEIARVQPRRQFHWVLGAIWDLDIAAALASGRWPVALYLVTSYGLMGESKPEWQANSRFWRKHVAPMIAAERWALLRADRLLASTAAIARDVEAAYGITLPAERLCRLPFGLPESDQPPAPFEADPRPLRVLFVGRFEKRKGIDELLEVIPGLLAEYPQVEFRLVGDDRLPHPEGGLTYRERFLAAHADAPWLDRVQFPGFVDDVALQAEYRACHIFVAPSRYESFGLIYLEAMREAKPCVGCQVGGIPEVVADGVTGLLTPPGDAAALAAALGRLINDTGLRQRLGEAGLMRYRAEFTVAAFAERVLGTLERG